MRLLFLVALIVAAFVGYGYHDAYTERSVDQSVLGVLAARVVNEWGVHPDTMVLRQNSPRNSDVFVSVTWNQPSKTERISSIHVKGIVKDGDAEFASFDAPCERAGSSRLDDAIWVFGGGVSQDLECYVALNRRLQVALPENKLTWPQADAQIADMKVIYTASAMMTKTPMRYVIWINQACLAIRNFISAPFQRN